MEPRSQAYRRSAVHGPKRQRTVLRAGTTLLALLALTACGTGPLPDPAPSATSAQPSPAGTGSAGSPSPSTPAVTAQPTPSATPSPSPPAPTGSSASASAPVSPTAQPSATATGSASPAAASVTQRKPGWALDRIDQRQRALDGRYTVEHQGRGVTVYVLDGLFDVKNAELGGRASVGLKSGRGCALEDGIDHGLFVAGIVAGRRTGVAKQARLVSVGALNGCEGGTGDETEAQQRARLVRALGWVAENARRPAVVNLSLNLEGPTPTVDAAVRRVVDAGVTVVASAGNQGEDACRYPPAGLPSVVTVAAATRQDRDAGLNRGRCVDLFAPGEDITSVVNEGLDPDRVVVSEGAATSWAAPFVSGAAALYLSAHPEASPAQVERWLVGNATRGALRGKLSGSPNRLLHVRGI